MKESLSPHIDSFLSMVAVEKGLAKNTVEAYSRDLCRLAEFLISRGVSSWPELKPIHLRSYFSFLRKDGLSNRSIARHIVTARRLCRFLETEEVIRENPVPALLLTPPGRKLPQTLSGDDVRALLSQPDPSDLLGSRDRAMLELLYAAGLRVSELVSLETQQINFQGNYLTVKGKGSKVRAVPFGRWANEALIRSIQRSASPVSPKRERRPQSETEYWSRGVMERWSIGSASLPHSITPVRPRLFDLCFLRACRIHNT